MAIPRSVLRSKLKWKVAFGTTALACGVAAAKIGSSDHPATTFKLCTTVPLRLFRLSVTAATIAFGIFLNQPIDNNRFLYASSGRKLVGKL